MKSRRAERRLDSLPWDLLCWQARTCPERSERQLRANDRPAPTSAWGTLVVRVAFAAACDRPGRMTRRPVLHGVCALCCAKINAAGPAAVVVQSGLGPCRPGDRTSPTPREYRSATAYVPSLTPVSCVARAVRSGARGRDARNYWCHRRVVDHLGWCRPIRGNGYCAPLLYHWYGDRSRGRGYCQSTKTT